MMFPEAQFLFIIRDGRQVADSMRKKWQWDIARTATEWTSYVFGGLELQRSYPKRVLEIRYENLCKSADTQFQRIFEFLNLEHTPASADFMLNNVINVAPGTEDQSSMEKLNPRWHDWNHEEMSEFMKTAGPLLKRLGYQ